MAKRDPRAITPEQHEAAKLAVQTHGTKKDAAQSLGISESALQRWLKATFEDDEDRIEYPDFVTLGDDEEPIEAIIDRLEKGFKRKHKAAAARKWFQVRVKETKPYGVIAFGDPHLGDPGCNVPLLKSHLEIARRDGVYGINIGDTTNNWVGRLMRLYAEQETSAATEKRLAEWFMFDAGVKWLCWILGNHDEWNGGSDFQKRLGGTHIPIIDWKAQFKVTHPTGTEIKVDAAHGRKGSSIWNELHGTLRAAKLGDMADVYYTGHTHNFALQDLEIPDKGHNAWLVQLRGYKWHDHHALVNSFPEYQRGASVFTICDPRPDARRRVQCFEDVEFGADVMEWMRGRA
ncbi:hypothetical protein [Oricola thermophila]|uniref:Uncharacterized protein n=1 Tax=Oricola thermophila TaxID=2742145 RepID=A0A6N1VA43_9HYPH|nr:hypothetical protein [Oricola thermophila]QKV17871.1 hypothetical protein HTY61_05050 [Oricola thermophila]